MLKIASLKFYALFGLLPLITATIYPTQPIATTVFHGNQNNTVSWLGGSGNWDLQLLNGDEVSPHYLTKNFSASKHSLTVFLPSDMGGNGNRYYLRFMPLHGADSSAPIYTARFTLDNMIGSSNSPVNTLSTSPAVLPLDRSGQGSLATASSGHASTLGSGSLSTLALGALPHSTTLVHPIASPISPIANATISNNTVHPSQSPTNTPVPGSRISHAISRQDLKEFGLGLAIGLASVYLFRTLCF